MRTPHAFNRAITHIESLIAPAGSQVALPPVRQLAASAGVSLVTMVKALKSLRAQERLPASARRRTPAVSKNRSDVSGASGRRAQCWARLRDAIMHDIVVGEFRHSGVLPSLKEMRTRYGGNYRTVRKSLDDLQRAGVIAAHGRGHRLVRNERTAGPYEILVFVYCETENLRLVYLDTYHLRSLETLCHAARARPTFIRYKVVDDEVHYTNHSTGARWSEKSSESVLGCIWLTLFASDALPDVCQRLLRMRKPIAVSQNPLVAGFSNEFRRSSFVKFFTGTDPARYGRDVGRHLLRLGHRNVAYLCTQIDQGWAQARLSGLREVYAASGLPHEIAVYGSSSPPVRENKLLARDMALLLRQAYPSSCTAWVCSDDFEALRALDFLKRNSVRVPEVLSVVGFNNSLKALDANLTSYDHGTEAEIAGMVGYVLRPSSLGPLRRTRVIETEGFVVERRSSGRAPR